MPGTGTGTAIASVGNREPSSRTAACTTSPSSGPPWSSARTVERRCPATGAGRGRVVVVGGSPDDAVLIDAWINFEPLTRRDADARPARQGLPAALEPAIAHLGEHNHPSVRERDPQESGELAGDAGVAPRRGPLAGPGR